MLSSRSAVAAFVAFSLLLSLPAAAGAGAGDIIVGSDGGGNSVVRINPRIGSFVTLATGAPAVTPVGGDFARDGGLFVADSDLPGVLRVSPLEGGGSTPLASGLPFNETMDVEFGPNGALYANEYNAGIFRVNTITGDESLVADGGDLSKTLQMAIRPSDGMIFVASSFGKVVRVNPFDGSQGVIASDGALSLTGITLGPDGRMYVSNVVSDTIYRVANGAFTPVASGNLIDGPYDLGVDFRGNLLVASLNNDRVIRINPRTGAQSQVAQGEAGNDLDSPEGLTVEPPRCGGKMATIVGTNRGETIRGSRFADVIAGLGGRDRIYGRGGRDIICGGGARDRLYGGAGRARLLGGPGRDLLLGGPARDRCIGGPGRDRLRRC